MVSETKVTIKNLYKIFGKDPAGMISHVQNGTTKQELLEKYGSVLALNDVNIDILGQRCSATLQEEALFDPKGRFMRA